MKNFAALSLQVNLNEFLQKVKQSLDSAAALNGFFFPTTLLKGKQSKTKVISPVSADFSASLAVALRRVDNVVARKAALLICNNTYNKVLD